MNDDGHLIIVTPFYSVIIFELIVCLIRAGCHSVKERQFLKINGKFRVRTKKVSFQIVKRVKNIYARTNALKKVLEVHLLLTDTNI